MLRLNAIKSEKIWGYELWIASTHPNGCQKEFEAFVGGDYPLLVKVIQADDTLSVQVHPDDELAAKLENCRGKTECWYILDAKEDSKLIYGMNGVYSDDELKAAINGNALEDKMRYVGVKRGDFAYIPAGTVHAIGGGLRLMEVQQSSDITYRLYDWGRGRECHVEKGIASIKNRENQDVVAFGDRFDCEYFTLEQIDVASGSVSFAVAAVDSPKPADYALVYVLEGKGKINGEDCCAEEIFALAPGEQVVLEGGMKVIKILAKDA